MFDINFPWDQELILTPGLCVLVTWVDLTRVTDLGSLLLYSSHPISHPRSRDGKRFARDCSAGWGIPHPGKEF